jgi:hypothetical protein
MMCDKFNASYFSVAAFMTITKNTLFHCVIAAIVIASYVVFLQPFIGKENFPRLPESFYQLQTEGFLWGQLNMSLDPDPVLARLDNPYDPLANGKYKVLDLTYYHHKYYLYFGPLPILTYFLPIKLFTGYHGAPALALFLYVAIGFIFNFLLIIKIRNDHFPTVAQWQVNLLGLMLGIANNTPYLQYRPRTYEIAIACAYAVMSIALYYLYKIFSNTFRARDYYIFSTTLALTVACRPHFTFVCVLLITIVSAYILLKAPKDKLKALLLALWLPAMCLAAALATYNYLRFDSIFEFGHTYQLGKFNYLQLSNIPSDFYRIIPLQLYYYLLQPYLVTKDFYIPELPTAWLAKLTDNTIYEPTIGLLATAPIVLMILYFGKFVRAYLNNKQAQHLLWFQVTTVLFTAMMFAIICMVYYTSQRYVTDFLPYLLIASIINLWFVQTHQLHAGFSLMIFKLFTAFAIAAGIVMGVQMGLLAFHPAYGWVQLSILSQCVLTMTVAFIVIAATLKLCRYLLENVHSKLISART